MKNTKENEMTQDNPRLVGYTRRWGNAEDRAREAQRLWTDRGIAEAIRAGRACRNCGSANHTFCNR
jgi:hypothetical protein